MHPDNHFLTVNPGSSSTKVALTRVERKNEEPVVWVVKEKTLRHPDEELRQYAKISEQLEYRFRHVQSFIDELETEFSAVVGRGGLARPVGGGTYVTTSALLSDLETGIQGEHPSNLGGLIAHRIGEEMDIPSFIVDPVSVDELSPEARISGLPEIQRISLWHALNCRASARKAAAELGHILNEVNLVVIHLGSGITVAAMDKGRAIDVNNATAEGPFGPDRAGGLPATGVVDLAFSGNYSQSELKRIMMGRGGFYAYLGTRDMIEIEKRAHEGDEQANLLLRAMVYQIAKEAAAMSSVLLGNVDAIVITGGMARSKQLTSKMERALRWIAPIIVIPGENEVEALTLGAWRVLQGVESAAHYPNDSGEG